MNEGKTIFAQVMAFAPHREFQRCVRRYNGDHRIRRFGCWDHFLTMTFAQLCYRESLRDIEACLRSRPGKLYHMGFRTTVSRNTLAVANEKRDWRIYADFAQVLIHEARRLYADEDLGLDLEQTTLTKNRVRLGGGAAFEQPTRPTAVQERAFELLGVTVK